MIPDSFSCYLVTKRGKDAIETEVQRRSFVELPQDEVLIRVAYSSLNYKDALATRGHPGIVRRFPHVPGIDAAGTVVESPQSEYRPQDEVIVSGFDLGTGHWGGWSEYVRVPAKWLVRRPTGLSLFECMVYGTPGFTAALGVRTLMDHGIQPDQGQVVVTGATGGVGVIAVMLLAKLGYDVVAVSGKVQRHKWLLELGAQTVLHREELTDTSGDPLLTSRWAGAIDSVGGNTLTTLVRSTRLRGCVVACGLVEATDLPLTVYPFILRGVTLAGIDSAWCPYPIRLAVWQQLSSAWKLDGLDSLATRIRLHEVDAHVQKMLAGQMVGRAVIDLQ